MRAAQDRTAGRCTKARFGPANLPHPGATGLIKLAAGVLAARATSAPPV